MNAEAIVDQLDACPTWYDFEGMRENPSARDIQFNVVKAIIRKLSSSGLDELRKAVAIVSKWTIEGSTERAKLAMRHKELNSKDLTLLAIEKQSVVIFLNRLIFDCPIYAPKGFSGVLTRSRTNRGAKTELLWPLAVSADGVLELVGFPEAGTGRGYVPLQEFDAFASEFARRQVIK